jgi:hypothetical protein
MTDMPAGGFRSRRFLESQWQSRKRSYRLGTDAFNGLETARRWRLGANSE